MTSSTKGRLPLASWSVVASHIFSPGWATGSIESSREIWWTISPSGVNSRMRLPPADGPWAGRERIEAAEVGREPVHRADLHAEGEEVAVGQQVGHLVMQPRGVQHWTAPSA